MFGRRYKAVLYSTIPTDLILVCACVKKSYIQWLFIIRSGIGMLSFWPITDLKFGKEHFINMLFGIVVLGGITCDSHDYYDCEEHINEVFLPKLGNGEPLYVGFFHTGAYQDQISGYGGIKHCLIPSPKHIIVGYDKNGKLTDWVYAKEQTAQSMLKILGY